MINARPPSELKIIRLALLLAALVCRPAHGQQLEYNYDASGNVVSITTAGSASVSLIAQPQSQLLESNAPVAFSVVAAGPGISYQWLANGAAIAGATGDSLLFTNLSGSAFASYSVVVSNASGAVTSAPAAIWPDSNGTGMPDWWQMEYFGNLNQLPTGDYDNDGVQNLDEYLEGTNPTNAASFDPRLYVQSVNGVVTASPDQPYYTMGQIVTLTAIPNPNQAFLGWTGSATGSKTTISFVMSTNKSLIAVSGLTLPVALDNSMLVWTTGGTTPWFGQTDISEDGLGAAQSGFIVAGDESWLQGVTNLAVPMQLSFWWTVSSQPGYGALSFAIDGNNSTTLSIDGTPGVWSNVQTNLPAGQHTLLWTYQKADVGVGESMLALPLIFADAGWVDEVTLTPATTPTNSPPVLSITLSNAATALISWPAPSTGFVLQQSSSLTPTNWVDVTNLVTVVGSENQVEVLPADSNQFYRLKY